MNNSTKDGKVRGVIEINFPPAESDGSESCMSGQTSFYPVGDF